MVVFFALQTFYRAGQFKSISDKFSGSVTNIYTNVPGPEDMQIDRQTEMIYISATDRRKGNTPENGIYKLDVNEWAAPQKIATDFKNEFNPHGISIYRADRILYLYAINHSAGGDFVESFVVEDSLLRHRATFQTENICCPNDLVVTDLDKFYLSNDHGAKNGIRRIIEDYLKIPKSSIYYYNGRSFKKVAKPFHYANGINISPDGKKLYLAETTGSAISTFEILDEGNLQQLGSYDTGTGVDNIDVDEEGNLWVAAHPKLLSFVKHSKDSVNYSPSQVLKLIPSGTTDFTRTLVYQNTGDELSGSSVAVELNGELFVGVVFERTLLRARLDK